MKNRRENATTATNATAVTTGTNATETTATRGAIAQSRRVAVVAEVPGVPCRGCRVDRPPRPMKDSGLKWVGQIPAGWQAVRAGWVMYEVNNRSELFTIKLPLPPLSEQHAIAAAIEATCAKVDAIVAKRKRQLNRLDALKRSLVYEYVTGKKEVVYG